MALGDPGHRAKWGEGGASAGGMHISPWIARPWVSRHAESRVSTWAGETPPFCGSSRLLTWIRSFGAARPLDSLAQRRGQGEPVEAVDDVEQLHRLPGLVGLQRATRWSSTSGKRSRRAGTWPSISAR